MLLPVEPEVVPLLVPEGSVVPGVLGLSVSGLSVPGLSVSEEQMYVCDVDGGMEKMVGSEAGKD